MRCGVLGLAVAAGLGVAAAAEPTQLPAPAAVAKVEATPAIRFVPGQRAGEGVTRRNGLAYAGATVLDVTEPRPDTLHVVLGGNAAVGGLPCEDSAAEVAFDVAQDFRIEATRPTAVRLVLEAQLVGLLRGNREGAGTAAVGPAEVAVLSGGNPVVRAGFAGRSHAGKESVFMSDRAAPCEAVVAPGEYTLVAKFVVSAAHPHRCFHKNVMTAVFSPEAAKFPEWMVLLDPTREAPKQKDLGFRAVLRAEPAR